MLNCKPISTLVDTSSKLPSQEGQLLCNPRHYRGRRTPIPHPHTPDIAYDVQQACCSCMCHVTLTCNLSRGSFDTCKARHIMGFNYISSLEGSHTIYCCRLGRMSRHTQVYFWVSCLPWHKPHFLVIKEATHYLKIQCQS